MYDNRMNEEQKLVEQTYNFINMKKKVKKQYN